MQLIDDLRSQKAMLAYQSRKIRSVSLQPVDDVKSRLDALIEIDPLNIPLEPAYHPVDHPVAFNLEKASVASLRDAVNEWLELYPDATLTSDYKKLYARAKGKRALTTYERDCMYVRVLDAALLDLCGEIKASIRMLDAEMGNICTSVLNTVKPPSKLFEFKGYEIYFPDTGKTYSANRGSMPIELCRYNLTTDIICKCYFQREKATFKFDAATQAWSQA